MLTRALKAPASVAFARTFSALSTTDGAAGPAKDIALRRLESKASDVTHPWNRYLVDPSDISVADLRDVPGMSSELSEFKGRVCTILKPCKEATSNMTMYSSPWTIKFDHTEYWSNPLMGYLSHGDTLGQFYILRFETKEETIFYCERHGYTWEVQAPNDEDQQRPKSYAHNFLPEKVQKEIKKLGPRKSRFEFKNSKYGKDTWLNRRRTQYGSRPWEARSELETQKS